VEGESDGDAVPVVPLTRRTQHLELVPQVLKRRRLLKEEKEE
jgi:hypothetical protein